MSEGFTLNHMNHLQTLKRPKSHLNNDSFVLGSQRNGMSGSKASSFAISNSISGAVLHAVDVLGALENPDIA
jgi:hypothetical protein